MRPQYETDDTRDIEQMMATYVAATWRCEVKKLPLAYLLDYAAVRLHYVRAWLELKRRYRTLAEHDRVFLSLQKVMAAKRLRACSGLPCWFVTLCTDGYFYADILARDYEIEFRGRTDRNDWQDQEPVIAIPVGEFRPIEAAAL